MKLHQPPTDTPQRSSASGPPSGCGRPAGGCLLLGGGLMLLLSTLALFFAVAQGQQLVTTLTRPFSAPTPTASLFTPAVIIQRLRGASELTTAISTIETVIDIRQDQTLGPFTIGRTRLLYVAHGQVRAGVDLAALKADDVSVVGETVTVRLPPPTIQDKKVDVERSRVFDIDRHLFAPAAPELQTRAERDALEQILLAACEDGILETANSRAETAVRALVESTSRYTVRVVTRPPPPGECPRPTPLPNAPGTAP